MDPKLTLQVPPLALPARLPAVDELKGLAILLVVLYHAGGVLGWANHLHGDLGVDMFVIVSGLTLALSPAWPGAGPFLRRRLLRIYPAYWIVLTVLLLLNTHFLQHKYSPANIALHYLGLHGWFGDAFAMTISDSFWFVTLIVSLYLLYALLRRFLDRPEHLLLAGSIISVAAAFAWFFTGQAGSFGHLGLRIPGFFAGMLLGQLLRTGRLELSLGPILLLAVLLITYVPYTQGIVFHTGVVALGLMGVHVFALRPVLQGAAGAGLRRILKFLGDHSLEIFLLHQPLIREYNVYLHGRWFNVAAPDAPSLLMGMAAGLAVTLLLSVELHRILQRVLSR